MWRWQEEMDTGLHECGDGAARAQRCAVPYNRNSYGPTVRNLGTFLKKTGNMGGGDCPSYYWGYVLCEKLRIWEGAKKTKAREEAEVK